MKYFIDTEFHEYQKKPLFGKPIDTIELISVGIVSEDNYIKGKDYSHPSEYKGREYYAISKDFNLKEAWNRYDIKYAEVTRLVDYRGEEYDVLYYLKENEEVIKWKLNHPKFKTEYISGDPYKDYWLRNNVLKSIFNELVEKELEYFRETYRRINTWTTEANLKHHIFNYKNFKRLINKYGKTNKQISEEILHFTHGVYTEDSNGIGTGLIKDNNPQFYGYYSDYDWVVFCWLFGRMVDLPKGFPMYCIDLKQILDEINDKLINIANNDMCRAGQLRDVKTHPNYPKQTNEHNSLADAHFNYNLYKFLQTI